MRPGLHDNIFPVSPPSQTPERCIGGLGSRKKINAPGLHRIFGSCARRIRQCILVDMCWWMQRSRRTKGQAGWCIYFLPRSLPPPVLGYQQNNYRINLQTSQEHTGNQHPFPRHRNFQVVADGADQSKTGADVTDGCSHG